VRFLVCSHYHKFRDAGSIVITFGYQNVTNGWLSIASRNEKIDREVKVCFLTATEMDFEKFRKEKEFYVLNKERFLRKPTENKEIIKEITGILNSVTRG
jgi:hypothetical protein